MPKSRFFRVAVEGATTDGRAIDAKWLQEMADSYNPVTYAARVNLEHIRGVTPDGPFQAYGDVLSLKTEKVALTIGGKTEQRLALFAEIDALDPLVKMNQLKQKLYTSVEIQPNFAGTNKAYLVGLAVTDSPASLGTEMLQFAASQGDKSPLAARKQAPGNLFSASEEVTLEFADETPSVDPTGIFASVKGLIEKLTGTPTAPVLQQESQEPKNPVTPASPETSAFAAFGLALGEIMGAVQKLSAETTTALSAIGARMAKVETDIEAAPKTVFTPRPIASGGATPGARTDC
jgi:hypothetical protein